MFVLVNILQILPFFIINTGIKILWYKISKFPLLEKKLKFFLVFNILALVKSIKSKKIKISLLGYFWGNSYFWSKLIFFNLIFENIWKKKSLKKTKFCYEASRFSFNFWILLNVYMCVHFIAAQQTFISFKSL